MFSESESSTDAELDLTPVTSGNITPAIELDLTSGRIGLVFYYFKILVVKIMS